MSGLTEIAKIAISAPQNTPPARTPHPGQPFLERNLRRAHEAIAVTMAKTPRSPKRTHDFDPASTEPKRRKSTAKELASIQMRLANMADSHFSNITKQAEHDNILHATAVKSARQSLEVAEGALAEAQQTVINARGALDKTSGQLETSNAYMGRLEIITKARSAAKKHNEKIAEHASLEQRVRESKKERDMIKKEADGCANEVVEFDLEWMFAMMEGNGTKAEGVGE
ncbi:hypothetical protein ACHAQI_009535 [Fusarium lateritium]